MGKYLLFLSYIGTQYRGAQKSVPNGILLDPDSIQGALECALQNVFPKLSETPKVILSSRTDAGVHALKSAVHADILNPNGLIYNPTSITKYLNRYLTRCEHEIRVIECIPVNDLFHARYKAKSRTYMYRFMFPKTEEDHKIPILEKNKTFFIKDHKFDIEKVKSGLKLFQGVKNFETFSSKNKDNYKLNIVYVRRLDFFTVKEVCPFLPEDPISHNFKYYAFFVKSRSFLYNQVRRMVGCLFGIGSGRLTEQNVREMIEVPNIKSWHPKAVQTASHGLYLMNVEYDEEELKNYKIYPGENSDYQEIFVNNF